MSYIRIKKPTARHPEFEGSDNTRFRVVDSKCIGRTCLNCGFYQVRGATLAGSRNTGHVDPCCMRQAYHGCPTVTDPEGPKRGITDPSVYSAELEAERKRKGYVSC